MLEELRGRTAVLAFVDEWAPDEAIRAELRGLGAVLVVFARKGAWRFSPDDDVELWSPGGAAREEAARAYGVDGKPELIVLDDDGAVRFRGPGGDASSLGAGLAAAGRALIASGPSFTMTRRELLLASLAAGFGLMLLDGRVHARPATPPTGAVSGEVEITLEVNGTPRSLRIEPRVTLLDALRERLGLTGSKKGCDHGQCGACTVLLDGRRVNSCLVLAIMTEGQKVTTIEGLARGDKLHPVQAAFIAEDGFQCGYCTPGQIMSAVALLAEGRARTDDEVREAMSGNLCRCGAYPGIVAAVQRARKAV